jgi:hypothetical protein
VAFLSACGGDETTDYATGSGCSSAQETSARAAWIAREIPTKADNPTAGQCEVAADALYAALNDEEGIRTSLFAGTCYFREDTAAFRELKLAAEARQGEWAATCGSGFGERQAAALKRQEFRTISKQPAAAAMAGLRGRGEWETYVPNVDLRRCIEEAYSAAPNEKLAFYQASCQVMLGMPAADPWPLPSIRSAGSATAPLPLPIGEG